MEKGTWPARGSASRDGRLNGAARDFRVMEGFPRAAGTPVRPIGRVGGSPRFVTRTSLVASIAVFDFPTSGRRDATRGRARAERRRATEATVNPGWEWPRGRAERRPEDPRDSQHLPRYSRLAHFPPPCGWSRPARPAGPVREDGGPPPRRRRRPDPTTLDSSLIIPTRGLSEIPTIRMAIPNADSTRRSVRPVSTTAPAPTPIPPSTSTTTTRARANAKANAAAPAPDFRIRAHDGRADVHRGKGVHAACR